MPRGVPRIPQAREYVLTRTCTGCGETKPWAKFSPAKYWEDGSVRVVVARCHECASAETAKRYPEYRARNRARLNAYNREWEKRKRARLKADESNNSVRLPGHPFKVLVWERLMEMEEPSWTVLAEQCGVPERSLRRAVSEQENVSLQLADRVCTRLGASIYDLWPHLAEEQAA